MDQLPETVLPTGNLWQTLSHGGRARDLNVTGLTSWDSGSVVSLLGKFHKFGCAHLVKNSQDGPACLIPLVWSIDD